MRLVRLVNDDDDDHKKRNEIDKQKAIRIRDYSTTEIRI